MQTEIRNPLPARRRIPKFLDLMKKFVPLWFGVLLLGGPTPWPAAIAQTPAGLRDFPAASVDEVIVPVPSEVFNVLDKLGKPDWRAQYLATLGRSAGSRAQVALLLGVVIAEGFVAVEAEDSERVKEIGREVLNLAGAINVQEAVIARAKSITEKAERKRWGEVRREFDGALQDVRGAMLELNDEDLAQLVSLGGWVRGTQVLTSIVTEDFHPDKAELLHQPELVAFFTRRIDAMPSGLRSHQLVTRIRETLPKIRPLIGQRDGSSITPEQVQELNALSSEIVQAITGNPAS
jgi:hypothetical protein